MKREELYQKLDGLGLTPTYAIDPVDGGQIEVLDIPQVEKLVDKLTPKPLTDEEIAVFWDWDLSAQWVRETLAQRIRDNGYIVVPAPKETP